MLVWDDASAVRGIPFTWYFNLKWGKCHQNQGRNVLRKTNSKRHVKLILEPLVGELIQERECIQKSTYFTRNQRKYVNRNCRYFKRGAVSCFQEYFRKLRNRSRSWALYTIS